MNSLLFTFLISLFALSPLQGEESISLTFEQLKNDDFSQFEGKLVQVRGFLSPHPDEGWVLASQPHLKSCCIGSLSQEQLRITENLSDVSTAYVSTVQGFIKKKASTYHLEQAQVIKSSTIPLFEIGVACFLAIFIWTCINLIYRKQTKAAIK